MLSPFVFSFIFPFCLILICFLAKDSLSLKYSALSLLEETYCLHLQGYIGPRSLLNSGNRLLKHGASSIKTRKSSSLRHIAPRVQMTSRPPLNNHNCYLYTEAYVVLCHRFPLLLYIPENKENVVGFLLRPISVQILTFCTEM